MAEEHVARSSVVRTTLSADVRERLEQPISAVADRDVLVLAGLLCSPPLVPPQAVRRIRKALVPDLDLDAEARLGRSYVVEAMSSDGWSFDVALQNTLRERLRDTLRDSSAGDRLGQAIRAVLDPLVADLSPLLRIEEELAWAYITEADPTTNADRILRDVVLTIALERRTNAIIWAAGALSRLPSVITRTSAGWVLSQICTAGKLPHGIVQFPASGVDPALLDAAGDLIPETLVGVRRDGVRMELGGVSLGRRVAITVPDVQPVTLTVEHAGNTTQVRVQGPAVSIPTGAEEVTLVDMRGRRFTLEAFESSAQPPEQRRARGVLERVERWWVERRIVRASVERVSGTTGGLIVSFPEASGLSAFVPASRSRVKTSTFQRELRDMVGTTIHVKLINVDTATGEIVAERAPGPWITGSLAVGDRVEAKVETVVDYGAFVSFPAPPDAVVDDDRFNALLHISEIGLVCTDAASLADPRQFPFGVGDSVELEIAEIDQERRRISLRHPFVKERRRSQAAALKPGDRLTGTVKTVTGYGLFVEIFPGVDGLVHVTELPEGITTTDDPRLPAAGSRVEVFVLSVDLERARIVLSTRRP